MPRKAKPEEFQAPTAEELEELTAGHIPNYAELDDEHKEYARQAMAAQIDLCDSGKEATFGESMQKIYDTAELLFKANGDRGMYLYTLTDGVTQVLLQQTRNKSDVFIIQGKVNEMVQERLNPGIKTMLKRIMRV